MKASEVYREAAKLMNTRNFPCGACYAIARAIGCEGYYKTPFQRNFLRTFKDGLKGDVFGDYDDPELKRVRVLALCFAAAIAESEGN